MSKLEQAQLVAGEVVEVVIDAMAAGGDGYVQVGGAGLVVTGALPGERVRARLRAAQKPGTSPLIADIVEVLEPSPQRRDPLCKRDAVCRGCQLRHFTVAGELEFKVQRIADVISDYTGLEVDEQPKIEVVTPQPVARGDAFRICTQMVYRRDGDEFELGLPTPVRKRLIPQQDCPAVTAPVQRLVAVVSKTLADCEALPWDREMVRDVREQVDGIDVALGIEQVRVVAPTHGVGLIDVTLTETDDEEHFQREITDGGIATWLDGVSNNVPEKVGVHVRSGGHQSLVKEPRRIQIPIDRWQVEVGFDDWIHTTLGPAAGVYQKMMEWLDLQNGDRLVDVGCGTGTISLMTAEQADEVVGVDANAASIEVAELNAIAHGLENTRFEVGGWEKVLRQLAMKGERFSAATINPFDKPLGHRVLAFLDVLGVQRLVYLGPAPKSAAIDIEQLLDMGWTMTNLAAANLHPATSDTMLMARLEV